MYDSVRGTEEAGEGVVIVYRSGCRAVTRACYRHILEHYSLANESTNAKRLTDYLRRVWAGRRLPIDEGNVQVLIGVLSLRWLCQTQMPCI